MIKSSVPLNALNGYSCPEHMYVFHADLPMWDAMGVLLHIFFPYGIHTFEVSMIACWCQPSRCLDLSDS